MSVQLTVEQTAFLQGPLSMNVGAVGRDGWPCVCRAQGVMVTRDRRALTVLLSASRGRAVIDALDAGSGITLVVSRPSTHATLQLKASAATRVKTGAAQRACSAHCVAAFADELKGLGYGAGLEQALAALLPTDDLVALRFAPEIVFDQTPGPDAGRVLART
ncbi:MAG: hypothetical protein K0M39_14155 [Rhizobium sp.]|nr:hypothetical protein [Rhizobium sp.]